MDPNDEIVISGIAGRFPDCENIEQFKEALLSGVDLMTVDGRRFPPGLWGIPSRSGKIPEVDKFDAAYFGIHPKQAHFMDPRQRVLNETIYEAIVDSGYNPKELRGTRTGVYVGLSSFSSIDDLRKFKTDGYTNTGLSMALAANRASYCFDLKGPSMTIDTACSSSVYALVSAFKDIKSGETESALVCGAQINFHPYDALEFNRLNMLAADGKCKVFSTERDGYARSETIMCILIQKKSKCRRMYATILGAQSNADGYKIEGITHPSSEEQSKLMKELYLTTGIDPNNISYVEAHGTGTPIGDLQECTSLVKTFCTNRTSPLLVGAVKTNMGHSEVSSGLCSITKALLAMEVGVIPANLHFESLDTTLPGICDNKLKVVTKNTQWKGGIVGVNSFGFGGANAHVILKSNSKDKLTKYQRPKHRLVHVSGRTEEAVDHFLDGVEANQDDEEFLALVDQIQKVDVEGHHFRGYTILGDKPQRKVESFIQPRPIWFIYTGMGSQWAAMGKDLMKFDVFRNTIARCAAVMKPYDVDIIDIITNPAPEIFDDISNCFCGIGAVEIAMTDLLYSFGIFPDGIAGHSLGEVGCSYADGQITTEQAMLLVFARGYASKNSKLPPGQMAAIGLSKEECQKLLPDGIFIACQNGKGSVTISGPADITTTFVEKLSSQGVFAKLVKSAGIAFHTKYVHEASLRLLDFVKGVLSNPKPRSAKWISSSVPPNKKDLTWANYNCAEYHYNNFSNTVLFDQIYEHIPENAIVIEVAPHGLLQAILKRELNPKSTNITLANRLSTDNEEFFLSAIGKIYLAGGQPTLTNLYTNVTFPVSRGTKMLSPFIKWDHSISWYTPIWHNKDEFGQEITINLSDESYSYLEGHFIDGRVLMPATGYLELVWQVLSAMLLIPIEKLPVIFENVHFLRATVLPHKDDVVFLVNIMKSGNFEIYEGGSVVSRGEVHVPKDISKEFSPPDTSVASKDKYLLMKREDIYKECQLRRYMYRDLFQGVIECDVYGLRGRLEWKGNFTSYLDTMLHLTIISYVNRDLMLPTFIRQLIIDPIEHLKIATKQTAISVIHNKDLNIIRSGGIEIRGSESLKAPRRQKIQAEPFLETYEFVSFESTSNNKYDTVTALAIALQIIIQNLTGLIKRIKICELITENNTAELSAIIKNVLNSQPMIDHEYSTSEPDKINTKYEVLAISEAITNKLDIKNVISHLSQDGFIIYKGKISKIMMEDLQVIYHALSEDVGIYLLRPKYDLPNKHALIQISNSDFNWLEKLKVLSTREDPITVYLYTYEDISGILGLVKCLLSEPSSISYRSIFLDSKASQFSIDLKVYQEQLRKNLTFSVLRNGEWGTFVHLPLRDIEYKDAVNAAMTLTTGDLSTLTWVERPPESIKYFANSELAYVFYSALNFRDVMLAAGRMQSIQPEIEQPSDIDIGLEYSGITASGKRVMGLVPREGLSLQIQIDPVFTWEIPDSWSLKEAATVPCVYATCYYALILRGHMQNGESILIHAGTGGIGLAAISIALSMDCTVYTTVGSKEKRDYLKKMFPKLEEKNIGNSRDKSFEWMIMANTKGKGVDIVLNSLSAELFQASLRCISRRGRFLEIGKVDFFNGTPINVKMFLKNCSFHGVLLDDFFDMKSEHDIRKKTIHKLLSDGLKNGVVRPLPSTIFSDDEVESAFRFLSSGKHKGKVLIEIRKEEPAVIRSPARQIKAIPKVYFDPDKSYILIGGLGGFGLELANWMILRGAKKIILNSRRDVYNGYQSFCLKKWSHYNDITVEVNTGDTTHVQGAEKLVIAAQKLGPVGGIFNMALVLKDALIQNQTKSNFEEVFKAKIISGQNMDTITRRMCPSLDHFVVFSSVACGRGNTGQTNYGMANSALERLCEKRRRENLPGLAVQWGPIADVGALAKTGIQDKIFQQILPQVMNSCLNTLEKFMLQQIPVGSSIVLSDKFEINTGTSSKTAAEAVAHILGIKNLDKVNKSITLSQLGLDSLMIAEIKQTLYRNYQIEISVEGIRDLTLDYLISLEKEDSTSTNNTMTEVKWQNKDTQNMLIPKDTVVILRNCKEPKRTVYFIHPIEGHMDLLKPLASMLDMTVYGLQSTKEANYDNMEDYASYFIERIKTIQATGPYFLCGYSYGAALALEMGLQLEKQGEKVDFVSIDGSPVYVRNTLRDGFMRYDKSITKSRVAILSNFASAFPKLDITSITNQLLESKDWNEQLRILSDAISKNTGLDSKEVAISADRFYKRCHAGFYYKPEGSFQGRILLIRREDNPFLLSDNYDLQKVCQREVEVFKIKGDHRTILEGDNLTQISNIISNKFLLL